MKINLIKVVDGNLLNANENIIGHQVNCRAKMGSGIAKQIRLRFPKVYSEYLDLFKENSPESILNHCQIVDVSTYDTQSKFIANLFGQLDYGYGGKQYTDIPSLQNALKRLCQFAKENTLSVALPWKIGSDRGGASWDEVYELIDWVFEDYEVTLYRLT